MSAEESKQVLNAQELRAVLKRLGSFFLEGQTAYEVEVDGVCYAAANYLENPVYFGADPGDAAKIRASHESEEYIIDFIFAHIGEISRIGVMVKDPFLVQMIEKQVHMAAPDMKTEVLGEHRLDILA